VLRSHAISTAWNPYSTSNSSVSEPWGADPVVQLSWPQVSTTYRLVKIR
jgi:hypothetical protein